jgi:hypothetical protein
MAEDFLLVVAGSTPEELTAAADSMAEVAEATGNSSRLDQGNLKYGGIMRDMANAAEILLGRVRALAVALVILALLSTACTRLCLAQQTGREGFSSPEEASRALFLAVQHNDERAMLRILGAGKELISSDDEAQDKLARERFVQKYEQMHRLVQDEYGAIVLYVGAENWPFPTPLVSSHGSWYFDAEAGMQEVLLRRIGENELNVLHVCHAHIIARSADQQTPPYDHAEIAGLLVNVGKGGPAVAFHGYYFRRLESAEQKVSPAAANDRRDGNTTPAPFAFVAYPAEYRSTGVMTFVVDRDGNVYEKDLGPNTVAIAKAMSRQPTHDATWRRVDDVDLAS